MYRGIETNSSYILIPTSSVIMAIQYAVQLLYIQYIIQWNLSIEDTIGTSQSDQNVEVSLLVLQCITLGLQGVSQL